MSEPTRFSDGGGNELERLLVDSVRDDAPSPRTRRRVGAALGLGAAVSTATASTGALGATVKTSVTLGVAKWIGIATVGVALAGAGTASYLSKGASTVAAPQVTAPPRPPTPRSAIRVQTPPAAVSTVPMVTEAPAPPASVSTQKPVAAAASIAAAASVASARPAATLGDELRLLDEAHAALSAGDTSRALFLLDRHDREATKPALAPEALALRVEVYARLGDRASVTRTANRFLALYGDRPEAQRVRTILEANP
jgi:hypothetical protein